MKKRIAILGGGPAGLSTAWYLTSQVDWKDKYEVSIYQMGWRLGGKGASGRNEAHYGRIEEHGIHMFPNFYHNVWDLLKGVYKELEDSSEVHHLPHKTLEEAILPSSSYLEAELVDDTWRSRLAALPVHNPDERPWTWDGDSAGLPLKVQCILGMLMALGRTGEQLGDSDSALGVAAGRALTLFNRLLGGDVSPEDALRQLSAALHDVNAELDWKVHDLKASMEMLAAIVAGLVDARFWSSDFELDSIDGMDSREWLGQYGASPMTLASSAVNAVANALFTYPAGDSTKPQDHSAASFVMWFLRGFLAHGHALNFFAAGTGETVILPLFLALRKRGVQFKLFHRLDEIQTAVHESEGLVFEKLRFRRQVGVHGADYCPLIDVSREGNSRYKAWPSTPRWSKLPDDEELRQLDLESWREEPDWSHSDEVELIRGADDHCGFDFVVWALPPSMIAEVGDDTLQAAWKSTTTHITMSATLAVQLWMDRRTEALRTRPPGEIETLIPPDTGRYLCTSLPNPLNSVVDFDDLIDYENWEQDDRPQGLLYFVAQLQDLSESRSEALLRVRQATADSLRSLGVFFPGARPTLNDRTNHRAIDFDRLFVPGERGRKGSTGQTGEARLLSQYFRANVRPTELFAQAPPDSTKGRMLPWTTGFNNVAVAGDWVYTGLNIGSFEGAVTGGHLAAIALIGQADNEPVRLYGFCHPAAGEALRNVKPLIS